MFWIRQGHIRGLAINPAKVIKLDKCTCIVSANDILFAVSKMLPKYNMVPVGNISVQPQNDSEPRKFSKFIPKKSRRSRNHASEELIYFRQANPSER